jgi:hypothetical protein
MAAEEVHHQLTPFLGFENCAISIALQQWTQGTRQYRAMINNVFD